MLNVVESAYMKKQEYNIELTKYYDELKRISDVNKIEEFAILRDMPLEAVNEAGIFYVPSMTQMLLPQYLDKVKDFGVISETNNKPVYDGRWVIPIKDIDGLIQNSVGYLNGVEDRYIYATAKYYRRSDTLWGLENLNYAYDVGWMIVTEGITDALRFRSLGYKNSFARCGTRYSEYINNQVNRCRYGVINVHDRDEAGQKTKSIWKTNRYITLNIPISYKDADELCFISKVATAEQRQANREWLVEYIEMCKEWLLSQEHHGVECPTVEATMI